MGSHCRTGPRRRGKNALAAASACL
jgi:hypothetical protein